MKKMTRDASIHPKSVQKAADKASARRKRYADPAPKFRSSKVTRVKPDPRVWAKAKALANGDVSRLKVESETSVLVTNPKDKS